MPCYPHWPDTAEVTMGLCGSHDDNEDVDDVLVSVTPNWAVRHTLEDSLFGWCLFATGLIGGSRTITGKLWSLISPVLFISMNVIHICFDLAGYLLYDQSSPSGVILSEVAFFTTLTTYVSVLWLSRSGRVMRTIDLATSWLPTSHRERAIQALYKFQRRLLGTILAIFIATFVPNALPQAVTSNEISWAAGTPSAVRSREFYVFRFAFLSAAVACSVSLWIWWFAIFGFMSIELKNVFLRIGREKRQPASKMQASDTQWSNTSRLIAETHVDREGTRSVNAGNSDPPPLALMNHSQMLKSGYSESSVSPDTARGYAASRFRSQYDDAVDPDGIKHEHPFALLSKPVTSPPPMERSTSTNFGHASSPLVKDLLGIGIGRWADRRLKRTSAPASMSDVIIGAGSPRDASSRRAPDNSDLESNSLPSGSPVDPGSATAPLEVSHLARETHVIDSAPTRAAVVAQSRLRRKVGDDDFTVAVANLRLLRTALAELSAISSATFLAVTGMLAVTGVIFTWVSLNSGSTGKLFLAYSTYMFVVMLLFAYQPVCVTSAASAVLVAVSHSSSAPLVEACDRNSALLALMLSSSAGTDCVRVLGVRLEAGSLFRLGALIFSALLFVGRTVS